MRKHLPGENSLHTRAARGRAVLYGYGTCAADGHVRYTNAGGAELYGGSEQAHARMQDKALRIQRELGERGISLEYMTFEQYQIARDIVDKVNCE